MGELAGGESKVSEVVGGSSSDEGDTDDISSDRRERFFEDEATTKLLDIDEKLDGTEDKDIESESKN